MNRKEDLGQEMVHLWLFQHLYLNPRVQKPDHNIIVFGESGCGKSSIVNMIVGDDVAKVFNGSYFQNELYEADIGGIAFRIFDTAGLDEGDEGRVPSWKAVQGLYTLIRQLDGLSLLVFCIRGRLKQNTRANWILFNKVICGEAVPAIVVVTGLENEDNLDDWWSREENKEVFKRYKLNPMGVSCVVSVRGHQNEYAAKYRESQEKVRKLILDSHRREPWSKDQDAWFSHIYSEVYHAGICFFARKSKEFTTVMRNSLEEFVREIDMDEEDYEKLKRSLLHAEKVVEKMSRRKLIF